MGKLNSVTEARREIRSLEKRLISVEKRAATASD
jgi:hypothetical protein